VTGSKNELIAGEQLVNYSHSKFPVLQVCAELNLSGVISKVPQIQILSV
jgi:hypothetical protein